MREAVKQSKSMRQVLLKLNVSPYGGNYDVLKKAVKYFKIDTSHFLGQGWNKGNTPSKIRPINDYLNNEMTITSYKLKNRLIKENLKENICEICNNTTWNGKTIPLELHHKNGNNKDNNFDNIQLLCPNCHAFTDSYRNRK